MVAPRMGELEPLDGADRHLVRAVRRYVRSMPRHERDRFLTVVIPELLPRNTVWQFLRHREAFLLKTALLFEPRVVVTDVPLVPSEARPSWLGDRPLEPERTVVLVPVSVGHQTACSAGRSRARDSSTRCCPRSSRCLSSHPTPCRRSPTPRARSCSCCSVAITAPQGYVLPIAVGDLGADGRRHRLVSPDRARVPGRRRRLHREQGEPRRARRSRGCRGPALRLHDDRRRVDRGRGLRDRLGGAGGQRARGRCSRSSSSAFVTIANLRGARSRARCSRSRPTGSCCRS